MGKIDRFGITTHEELMGTDQERYRISPDNRIHRMGAISLELPVGAYRMPYEGGSEYSMFTWANVDGIESTLFCDRVDETIDDILEAACISSHGDAVCKSCARRRYIIKLLKPCEGEIVVDRGRFPFGQGEVRTLTTVPTGIAAEQNGLHYTSYQAAYFLNGIEKAPTIKLHHCLAATQYFCSRHFECKEVEDFSQLLHNMLQTVKVGPDR